MMIGEFRKYLDERIKVLGTELEECLCAKKALDRAEKLHSAPKLKPKKPSQPKAVRMDGVRMAVHQFVEQMYRPMSVREIAAKIGDGITPKQVSNAMWHLKKMGVATRPDGTIGKWMTTRNLSSSEEVAVNHG